MMLGSLHIQLILRETIFETEKSALANSLYPRFQKFSMQLRQKDINEELMIFFFKSRDTRLRVRPLYLKLLCISTSDNKFST